MIEWTRTSRLSIKISLSLQGSGGDEGELGDAADEEVPPSLFFFFSTLGLEMSDTKVCEP